MRRSIKNFENNPVNAASWSDNDLEPRYAGVIDMEARRGLSLDCYGRENNMTRQSPIRVSRTIRWTPNSRLTAYSCHGREYNNPNAMKASEHSTLRLARPKTISTAINNSKHTFSAHIQAARSKKAAQKNQHKGCTAITKSVNFFNSPI